MTRLSLAHQWLEEAPDSGQARLANHPITQYMLEHGLNATNCDRPYYPADVNIFDDAEANEAIDDSPKACEQRLQWMIRSGRIIVQRQVQ